MVFKLTIRELKNNSRYWFFFTMNLVIGLLGFTFIFLFRENISNSLQERSTQLLTSDIAITGRRDLSEKEAALVEKFMQDKQVAKSDLFELYSMGKSTSKSRLVFIKAIRGQYPLRGQISLEEQADVDNKMISRLNEKPLVWVSAEVAHQFKIGKGDHLKIGQIDFEVDDIVKSDTTSSMRGFSLAPKVYIGRDFLQQTGLVSYGTVAWRSRFFNLKEGLDQQELKKQLEQLITDPAIKVKTPENSSEQLSRIIQNLSDFLGLIGVVALLMSTVGISYLFQSYVFDRLKQLGILKSLGVTREKILGSMILVITIVGVLASLVTLAISKLLMPLAVSYLKQWFKGEFDAGIGLEIVITVISLSVLINLLTCLPILIKLFKEKTINLLKEQLVNESGGAKYLMYLPASLFLWGISVWQARSVKIGSLFFFSLVMIGIFVTLVLPILLEKFSSKLKGKLVSYPHSLEVGYGLRLLVRNKFITILMILCLSIGVSLISVIGQLDKSLKAQLTDSSSPKPSLFMFDIQQEQSEELLSFAQENQIPLLPPSPMVRARLVKKNGEKVKRAQKEQGFETREDNSRRRFTNRGVNLSYAAGLNESEKIVEGVDFSGSYAGEGMAEISLEKRYAQRIGVGVGDTLTYEVLGVEIQGKVINLRQVKWTSFLPNFFILFQPGVLEEAPKTFLSTVKKVEFSRQLEIQDLIVNQFPNISILNVTEIIQKILGLFKAMAWAIGIMSLCCIAVGVFVLYSILQNQLLKKQKELALQKLMGMSETSVLKIVFVEFSILILLSQLIGSSMGALIAFAVSQIFLDGVYQFDVAFFLIFNAALYLICLVTIFLTFKSRYQRNVKELLLN